MSLYRLALANLLLISTAVSVPAVSYKVAQRHPQASDDGPGSAEHPWKSIAHAAFRRRLGAPEDPFQESFWKNGLKGRWASMSIWQPLLPQRFNYHKLQSQLLATSHIP